MTNEELAQISCEADAILDRFLDPLGQHPQDAAIQHATEEYICAVLSPLFLPITQMPPQHRPDTIAAVTISIGRMVGVMADRANKGA